MIAHRPDANYLIITKALWLGFELPFVADSGLWDGHCFVPVAGNRHKVELQKRNGSPQRKNPQLPKQLGIQS